MSAEERRQQLLDMLRTARASGDEDRARTIESDLEKEFSHETELGDPE